MRTTVSRIVGVVVGCVMATAVPAAAAPWCPEPGTLLHSEPVTDVDPSLAEIGARQWKVWYASRSGLDDRHVVVSGAVIVPAGRPPAGGWRVVSWAHGTTGIADRCAPSRSPNLGGQLGALVPLVARGFVVAATDYEGLGTAGPHPYLSPRSEGRGVIDAVRAAGQLLPGVSAQWVAYGPSQGGQAAWAANELADTWGRGLDFRGSASFAPAADVSPVVDDLLDRLAPEAKAPYPLTLFGLRTQHSELDYRDYLRGAALSKLPKIYHKCVDRLVEEFTPLPDNDFAPRKDALPRLRAWLVERALPQRRASGPMFVGQGTADMLIRPAWNDAAIARACGMGDMVLYKRYPGLGHELSPAVASDAINWIIDRLNGMPAPNTCG